MNTIKTYRQKPGVQAWNVLENGRMIGAIFHTGDREWIATTHTGGPRFTVRSKPEAIKRLRIHRAASRA